MDTPLSEYVRIKELCKVRSQTGCNTWKENKLVAIRERSINGLPLRLRAEAPQHLITPQPVDMVISVLFALSLRQHHTTYRPLLLVAKHLIDQAQSGSL